MDELKLMIQAEVARQLAAARLDRTAALLGRPEATPTVTQTLRQVMVEGHRGIQHTGVPAHLDAAPPDNETGAEHDARLNAEAIDRARREQTAEANARRANAAAFAGAGDVEPVPEIPGRIRQILARLGGSGA